MTTTEMTTREYWARYGNTELLPAPTPGQLADELESGRWRKALKTLGKKSNYRCCLGVFCEMRGAKVDSSGAYGLISRPLITYNMPPDEIADGTWLRDKPVDETIGDYLSITIGDYLSILNDTKSGWDAVIEYLRELEAEGVQ